MYLLGEMTTIYMMMLIILFGPNQNRKIINYIDRLAYHHFYMWVLDTDFEIRDITGEPNDFKIELEDGRTAEFFYGYSSQVVHFVNNEDYDKQSK